MSRGWLESIAEASGLAPDQTERRLRALGITPDRPARPARSFVIERIAFTGEKAGKLTGSIDFEWSGLGPGVWAVTSDRNLVGKSTVLEIVLWCLRGSTKNLQADVRSWLNQISLDFSVDRERYRVAFNLEDDTPVGSIDRKAPDGSYHEIDAFASEEGFALVMSSFMMDALDLDPIPALQGSEEEKSVAEHGWTALSNAFYFGGDHKVLLGDGVMMAGLPARVLQMYVGLPWASTKTFVTTVKKEIEQKRAKVARAAERAEAQAASARTRLQTELDSARGRLEDLPMATTTASALNEAGKAVAEATTRMSELQTRAVEAQAEATAVQRTAKEDAKALRDLRETIVATQFFNGLKPECCPRCETKVPPGRIKAEPTELACSLCAESIPEDRFEDMSEALQDAENRAVASEKAAKRATADASAAQRSAAIASNAVADARSQLDQLLNGADFGARRDAELDIARLEGALAEINARPTEEESNPDEELVAIADKETRKAYEFGRTGILNALNQEILPLARRLGIDGLEEVALNSNASMKLKKGGASTTFTKVTAGERLRLRLATAIALLRVGRQLGIGRHPGLLIIDSPAAEEVTDVNLQALLGELQTIASETDGLQVIVASANTSEIVGALGEKNCLVAGRKDYVW